MGWVEWDEDGMRYMCVGCVGLVRLLSGLEKYTPSRKGMYLPQVCICKSGSQQMDACREVYRAWMKMHHVACTVYMQQSTLCKEYVPQVSPTSTQHTYILLQITCFNCNGRGEIPFPPLSIP